MCIDVIIVSYNSEKFIKSCIESIKEKATGVEYGIAVVDNASTDNSVETVKNNFKEIKLIENKENIGFSRAVNQAIRETDSEFILLLNPDTVLVNNAIKIFRDFMKANGKAASCGGALYDDKMRPVISYGFFPSLKQIFFEEFGLRKLFKNYYFNKLSPGCTIGEGQREPIPVDYVSGASMFIRRGAAEESGYLDERYFMYYEETDLSFNLKRSGYLNMVLPEAKIIHYEGKSFGNIDCEKLKVMKRSEFIFFKKHHGSFAALVAKILYINGCIFRLIFRFDNSQIKKINIIFNSQKQNN